MRYCSHPAFEGAEIEQGMLGIPGAVDMVSYPKSDRPIRFTTIEDKTPQGFCGSGLLDMLARCSFGPIQDSGLISDRDEVAENLKQYLAEVNEQVILIDKENPIYLTKRYPKAANRQRAIAADLNIARVREC